MLEGGLELLAVGTERAGRDEARREVGVNPEAGREGDGGEDGGEGDQGTGGVCNVGPGREGGEVSRGNVSACVSSYAAFSSSLQKKVEFPEKCFEGKLQKI